MTQEHIKVEQHILPRQDITDPNLARDPVQYPMYSCYVLLSVSSQRFHIWVLSQSYLDMWVSLSGVRSGDEGRFRTSGTSKAMINPISLAATPILPLLREAPSGVWYDSGHDTAMVPGGQMK